MMDIIFVEPEETDQMVQMKRLRNTGLPADIFNGSSGFNRFNHGDDLMLSKTGFTHSDLLCWQIDYAGGPLNVNGTIMRGTYSTLVFKYGYRSLKY